MQALVRRFLWLALFAVAMALLEAAVVVYIRRLLEITAGHVSLGSALPIELAREAATLVMLVTVGALAGRNPPERAACALFAFGLWDIGYYVWLRLLIGWPRTLLDWDILFLIPLTWWGPVLAPLLVALLLCAAALLAAVRLEQGRGLGFAPLHIAALALGGGLALYGFMADSLHALARGQPDWATLRPGPFRWPLFIAALALLALGALGAHWLGSWRRLAARE